MFVQQVSPGGCRLWIAFLAMAMNDSHTTRVSFRLLVSIALRNMVLFTNLICGVMNGVGGGGAAASQGETKDA